MKYPLALTLALTLLATLSAQPTETGFVTLMDGKTFTGWQRAKESPETWQIVDGAFVAHGARCHLFYIGDGVPYRKFELKVEVRSEPGSNGGIYFHTAYQDTGWPTAGFETQVNNTHKDWKKPAVSTMWSMLALPPQRTTNGGRRTSLSKAAPSR